MDKAKHFSKIFIFKNTVYIQLYIY